MTAGYVKHVSRVGNIRNVIYPSEIELIGVIPRKLAQTLVGIDEVVEKGSLRAVAGHRRLIIIDIVTSEVILLQWEHEEKQAQRYHF